VKQINVVIVDDHTILRQGLRKLLEEDKKINVLGEAGDGREALEKVAVLSPDVVLMDISMSGMNGLEAIKQIKRRYPKVKVLVLSMHKNEEYIYQAFKSRAIGYIVKDSAAQDVVNAIKIVSRGESYLSPCISKIVIDDYIRFLRQSDYNTLYESLTEREREIFQLLAEGKRNQEIAKTLHISIKTVETHRSHILKKLHLSNLAEIVKYAIEIGVIVTEVTS